MFVCKQKTAYEMRISDWSSDVCSSDLVIRSRRKVNCLRPLLLAAVSLYRDSSERALRKRRRKTAWLPRMTTVCSTASGTRNRCVAVHSRHRSVVMLSAALPKRLAVYRVSTKRSWYRRTGDRKSGVEGKGVAVGVDR